MADKQDQGDPAFEWLHDGGSGRDTGERSDADRTQLIRRRQRLDVPTSGGPPNDAAAAEHTQVLPRAASSGSGQQDGAEGGGQSFGGTYPSGRRSGGSGPRFADPAPGGKAGSGGAASGPPPRSGGSGSGRSTSGRSRRRWWLRVVLVLVLAWVTFLVAVPLWAFSRINKVPAEPNGHRPAATAGTTYLLVGSDSRAGLTTAQKGALGTGSAAGKRTDTILLLHVPSGGGPNLLLSIPRDSYVEIPGQGMNKINAAFSLGGPRLLVRTVEQATQVRVDDYVEVGFQGFVDIVNAVGGITVCPKTSITDRKAGHLHMKKGCQQIDGTTALDYSRSRAFPKGDITREFHQREVIAAIGSKAASASTVLYPWRYFAVSKSGADALTIGTNVGPLDLVRFAWAMAHAGSTSTKRCVVPYSSLGTTTAVGSVVTWDKAKADAIFAKIRRDDTAGIHCKPQ